MTNEQYQLEQMANRIAMLESRRDTESHKSFLGGGLGYSFSYLYQWDLG